MAITGTIYARYCVTLDNARYDEWIACFTEDGAFENRLFGRHAGPDGLKKLAELYKVQRFAWQPHTNASRL